MLEEAIGTQMYQEKRGRALKSLEKKDPDLASIEGVRTCFFTCLLYTSPSPRDRTRSRMPSSA